MPSVVPNSSGSRNRFRIRINLIQVQLCFGFTLINISNIFHFLANIWKARFKCQNCTEPVCKQTIRSCIGNRCAIRRCRFRNHTRSMHVYKFYLILRLYSLPFASNPGCCASLVFLYNSESTSRDSCTLFKYYWSACSFIKFKTTHGELFFVLTKRNFCCPVTK